jgi:phosphatidate phosphatase PAH1
MGKHMEEGKQVEVKPTLEPRTSLLSKRALDLSKLQMPNVNSNSSISTMCPTSEYGTERNDVFDDSDNDASRNTRSSGFRGSSKQKVPVPRTTDFTEKYESDSASLPTTIMIRNIPNRYSQRELMLELEELGLANSFDFVYLPIDKCTRANLGYAFVNFVDPSFAEACNVIFDNYRFKRHQDLSSKIAAVSIAHLQGLDANLAHYANTAVRSSRHRRRRPLVLTKTKSNVQKTLD